MPGLPAQRFEPLLERGAVIEVVQRLKAIVARVAVLLADLERLGEPLGGIVRGADRPHLSLSDQFAIGLQGLFERSCRVVDVRLVEVDVVGLEAPSDRSTARKM